MKNILFSIFLVIFLIIPLSVKAVQIGETTIIAEEQKNLTRAINNSGTQMRGKQDAIAEAQYRLGCSEIILAQIMQK